MLLKTTIDTYLKPSAEDSKAIAKEDLVFVKAQKEFPILAYRQEKGHIVFTIDPERYDLKTLHPECKNTFWIYEGAIEDPEGFSPANNPKDEPASLKGGDRGFPIKLPGYEGTYYSNQPVHATKAKDISWGEILHCDAKGRYRKPESAAVVNNLIQISIRAQGIRDRFGKPIIVRSGYRDPVTNRRVGGAKYSQHCMGNALDIAIAGHRPSDLYNTLNGSWAGGLAYSNSGDFLHIDRRSGNARWVYPGG